MIANRFNPLGRKFGKTAKHYIQDGLFAQFDGVENVGYGKHDNNATEWVDLISGTKKFVLTDEAGWDDMSIYRTANASNSPIGILNEFIVPTEEYPTLECVFNISSRYNVNRSVIFGFDSAGTIGLVATNAGDRNIFRFGGLNGNGNDPVLPFSYNTTISASSIFRNVVNARRAVEIWKDGELQTQTLWNNVNGYANGSLLAHSWVTQPNYVSFANIYSIRLYNKRLTEEEILHNYAIDKERFGL